MPVGIFRFDETTLQIQLRQIVFGSFAIDSLPTWRKEHFIQENFPHLKMQLILDTFYTPGIPELWTSAGMLKFSAAIKVDANFQLCHENVKLSRSLRFDETTLKIQLRQIVFGSFAIDSLPTWRKEHFIQENFPHLKMQLILDTFYTPGIPELWTSAGMLKFSAAIKVDANFQLCHENVKLSRSLLEDF